MKILYDLVSTQPNSSGEVFGSGNYGIVISFEKNIVISLVFVFLSLSSVGVFLESSNNRVVDNMLSLVMFWDKNKQKEIQGSSLEMRQDQVNAIVKEWKYANSLTGCGRGYREYYQDTRGGFHPELLGFGSILLLKLLEQGVIGLFLWFLLFFV